MSGVIRDGGVLIRAPTQEDVPHLYAAALESVAEVSPWLPWCHANYRQQETQEFVSGAMSAWARRDRFGFVICDAGSGAILGGVGIAHINSMNRLASMGYWVRTSCTRRGIATTAARLAAQFAFRELGLVRLEIVALPENGASRRVAEKLGARFECIARHRIVMHGTPLDAALYSLLPSDLE